MKKRLYVHIILILCGLFTSLQVQSQCPQMTRQQLIDQNGLDAIVIDEFTVKLKEGTIKRPVRTRKMEVDLEPGIRYRFSVFTTAENEGEAVIQLYDHRELLGSSYDFETGEDRQSFEYRTETARSLQLVFSSKQGRRTCATSLFSMVLEDTTTVLDSRIGSLENRPMEIFYIGIDNFLDVSASGVPDGYIKVSVDRGALSERDGSYSIRFEEPGPMNVFVQSFTGDSILHEESTTSFMVLDLPPPLILLQGISRGGIDKSQLRNATALSLRLIEGLHYGEYELLEFGIAEDQMAVRTLGSNGRMFSARQKDFLRNLNSGDEFYIKNAKIKKPDGSEITLEPIRFIVN